MKTDIVVMAAHISFAVSVFVLTVKMNKRRTAAADLYLPDECWESIFYFLINAGSNRHICLKRLKYLKPLCLVSKQFLSVTNRFIRLPRTDLSCSMCLIEFVEKLDEKLRNLAADYSGKWQPKASQVMYGDNDKIGIKSGIIYQSHMESSIPNYKQR